MLFSKANRKWRIPLLFRILEHRNVWELKKDEILSGYYSVRYDIWFDDIVKYYSIVNDAVGDLQNRRLSQDMSSLSVNIYLMKMKS